MKKSILFIFFLLSVSYSVFGQISVSGKVVDENGEVILHSVFIKNSDSIHLISTRDGSFEIKVKSENDTLIFFSTSYDSKKITVSQIIKDSMTITLEYKMNVIACGVIINPYKIPLTIRYWGGIHYNPYGIIMSKGFYINKEKKNRKYFSFEVGYSTNFKRNSNFYGGLGTDILGKHLYYIFQQTTFDKLETENRITTHFVGSRSNLKFIKTYLSYGVAHQRFVKNGLENSDYKNFGINLGLSKRIKYIGTISAVSFYWQDYWAWEANITKDFKRKIHTAISYRQTTQDFKEINLTLGYRF